MVLGVVIVLWSVDAFVVVPPSLNDLDIIDLLIGVVIAGTLVAGGEERVEAPAPRAHRVRQPLRSGPAQVGPGLQRASL